MADWVDSTNEWHGSSSHWTDRLADLWQMYFGRLPETDGNRIRRHWPSLDANPSFEPMRARLATVDEEHRLAGAVRHVVRIRAP